MGFSYSELMVAEYDAIVRFGDKLCQMHPCYPARGSYSF
jgi:hypothetical protein